MRKEVALVTFAVALLFVLPLISAAENQSKIDAGYACLQNLVENKASFSLQEAIFGSLALGSKEPLQEIIEEQQHSSDECWPKSSCKVKETAQVLLAKQRMNQKTDDLVDHLLEKNKTVSELNWLLEIDIANHEVATCTVSYDSTQTAIQVNEDMALSGSTDSCLGIDSTGFFLTLAPQCLGKAFEVSCDQDFITTLLYRKSSGGTLFVSSQTHSAASLGTTEEQVKAQCFSTSSAAGCDYEGSLWATLALLKAGEDVSNFVPYLLALADDNKRFFPSAFLLTITGGNDHFSNVVQAQKQGKYWEAPATPNNRFYDTSLALLSLQGSSAAEAEKAKAYLIEIQGKDGCWNNQNFRDTAFILYGGFPKTFTTTSSGFGGAIVLCETQGFSCEGATACQNAGGQIKADLVCASQNQFCCTVSIPEPLCLEQGGSICPSNQQCVGGLSISARDGSCCLGTCQVKEENTCELFGGSCRFACGTGEQQTSESCGGSGKMCCEPVTAADPEPTPSGSKLWIWVLGILILLVILGILLRKKIQLWLFKKKTFGSPSSSFFRPSEPPGRPPALGFFGGPRRAAINRVAPARAPARRPLSSGNKELDETMRKLREMAG